MPVAPPLIVNKDTEGRTFYLLDLEDFRSWPETLTLVSPHYVMAVFADVVQSDIDSIGIAMQYALRSGAVYICASGENCELVHDIADEIIVNEELESGPSADVIFTTWHSSEPEVDALSFFANAAVPAKKYAESCSSWVLVRIGKYRNVLVLENWLRDLEALDRAYRAFRKAAGSR
jgi:hypothetical protein